MARNRKPLAMQKGNLTILQQVNKEHEEQLVTTGNDQLNRAPSWLIDNVAKKEFKRIVKELSGINVIGNLDLNNLGSYCNAYSMYIKTTKELADQPLTLERHTQAGTIIVENPLINIQKKYAEEMRKFAATCGLTIDSRLKAATTKTTKTSQEIEARFGNI